MNVSKSVIIKYLRVYLFFCFLFMLMGCSSGNQNSGLKSDSTKILFDISEIDENGLIGPSDGKRSVAYKFYIPYDGKKKREVHRIDKSVEFYKKNIMDGELILYQCIGQGGTKETLLKLSGLKYINKIEPCYWE